MEMTFKSAAKGFRLLLLLLIESTTTSDANLNPEKPQFRYDCRKLDAHHKLLIMGLLMQNPCI